MRGFLLEGDEERIAELVNRMFNAPGRRCGRLPLPGLERAPAHGRLRPRLVPHPALRPLGLGREFMASFWIPVMAAGTSARPSVPTASCSPCRTSSSTTRCPIWAAARPTVTRRRWALRPRRRCGRARDHECLRRQLRPRRGRGLAAFLEVEAAGPEDGSTQRALEGPAGLVRRLVGDLPALNADGEIVLADLRLTGDLSRTCSPARSTSSS